MSFAIIGIIVGFVFCTVVAILEYWDVRYPSGQLLAKWKQEIAVTITFTGCYASLIVGQNKALDPKSFLHTLTLIGIIMLFLLAIKRKNCFYIYVSILALIALAINGLMAH